MEKWEIPFTPFSSYLPHQILQYHIGMKAMARNLFS